MCTSREDKRLELWKCRSEMHRPPDYYHQTYLPIYIGLRASWLRVEDILPETDVAWLVDAMKLGLLEKMMVLQATCIGH